MSCADCGTLRLETDAACGYHPAGSSEFEPSKLGPEGLQLEMYYALYPLAFAAVYGGAMNGGRTLVGAPRSEHTSFVLERRPVSLWVRFKNLVKDLIRFVRPAAVHRRAALALAPESGTMARPRPEMRGRS